MRVRDPAVESPYMIVALKAALMKSQQASCASCLQSRLIVVVYVRFLCIICT
jgi:hypothetical protein